MSANLPAIPGPPAFPTLDAPAPRYAPADLPVPMPAGDAPALPAGLVGNDYAALLGLYVGIVVDKVAGRLHIGLDAPAADALSTLVDNVVNSGIAQDPGGHGYNQDDADDLLAAAHAVHGPLLKLFGYQGDQRGGQFGADPLAAAAGLYVSVGIDKATGRAIITLDHAGAAAFDLVLDDLDDDDTGQPDHIARPMCAVKYAIKGGLAKLARR